MSGSSASLIVSRSMPFSCERVRERDALGVLEVADGVRVERAGGGGRAEQAAAEARALLVGPVDQLQRDLRASRPCGRAAPRARRRRRGSRRASRRSGRRRCASRRRRSCRSRPESSPTGFRRRRARPSRRSPRACRAATRAPCASPRSTRAGAPRPASPVSSLSSCRSLSGRSQSKFGMAGTIGATHGRVRGSSHACSAGRSQSSCLPCSYRVTRRLPRRTPRRRSRAAIASSTRRCSAGG